MLTTAVLNHPGHYPPLDQQGIIAVQAARSFQKDDGRDPRTSTWVGLWWNDEHSIWLTGKCSEYSDRAGVLCWYDSQRKPARVFLVKCGVAYLRCAKCTYHRPW